MLAHAPLKPKNSSLYVRFGKRCFDAVISFIGLLVLSPLLLLIAIAARLTSPGPALFLQIRTGQFEKPFCILKFRTMSMTPPGSGPLITASGDPRITHLGRWLRKTKLDELPQLFNVLAGHMSLVGPRPEVPFYTSRYTDQQKEVLSARPGITGPSINFNEEEILAGRTDREQFYLSAVMPAKLEIHRAYCSDIRFTEDLRILFLTLTGLFRRPTPNFSTAGSIKDLSTASGPPRAASTE